MTWYGRAVSDRDERGRSGKGCAECQILRGSAPHPRRSRPTVAQGRRRETSRFFKHSMEVMTRFRNTQGLIPSDRRVCTRSSAAAYRLPQRLTVPVSRFFTARVEPRPPKAEWRDLFHVESPREPLEQMPKEFPNGICSR